MRTLEFFEERPVSKEGGLRMEDTMETSVIPKQSGSRLEGMADVPGICELSLTRAVIQYAEFDNAQGSAQDIGLGLVVDGRFAGASEVLDLGSGKLKILDLSSELVILDWIHQPTLEHINRLIAREEEGLATYSFRLAIELLGRVGYGPLTRSTLFRIGFRDISQDLDLHEDTAVRIAINSIGAVVRAHLDYSRGSLMFTVPGADRCREKEKELVAAFPQNEVVCMGQRHIAGATQYEVLFSIPPGLDSLRSKCSVIRVGLMQLLRVFEPERYEVLNQNLAIFGSRDTLSRISLDEPNPEAIDFSDDLEGGVGPRSANTVH